MLRIPGVILLCLCVLAMPSYAAITCGSGCAATSDAHEHDCCPADSAMTTTTAQPVDNDRGGDSHDTGDGRHHHCTAPCCGFVAHVLTASVPHIDERPLADLLPTGSVLESAIDHDAIFHPPRA
jgi:hypothetical protein